MPSPLTLISTDAVLYACSVSVLALATAAVIGAAYTTRKKDGDETGRGTETAGTTASETIDETGDGMSRDGKTGKKGDGTMSRVEMTALRDSALARISKIEAARRPAIEEMTRGMEPAAADAVKTRYHVYLVESYLTVLVLDQANGGDEAAAATVQEITKRELDLSGFKASLGKSDFDDVAASCPRS